MGIVACGLDSAVQAKSPPWLSGLSDNEGREFNRRATLIAAPLAGQPKPRGMVADRTPGHTLESSLRPGYSR